MRNIFMITVLMLTLLVGITTLDARSNFLARDGNGYAIQLARSYATYADTTVTGTTADSLAVPANTVEATILVKDQIIYFRTALARTAVGSDWIQIPAGIPITVPCNTNTHFIYKALTGTAKVYFVWKKL